MECKAIAVKCICNCIFWRCAQIIVAGLYKSCHSMRKILRISKVGNHGDASESSQWRIIGSQNRKSDALQKGLNV